VGGEAFSVTPTEFDFLSYLLERAGQAVSKQELMREIWKLPDYELDTRVADDLVKRLRRKLKEAGCSALVKTVWGFGFRLEGGKEGET
jgi:DNA-binding response OmpR family regulator